MMSNCFKLDRVSIRRLSLFCVIIQSFGIRFFSGLGFLLMGVVILLNVKRLHRVRLSHPSFFVFTVALLLIVALVKGFSLISVLYIFCTVLSAFSVLVNYDDGKANFIEDITAVLWFLTIYGFISWILLVLLPQIFINVRFGIQYRTFCYIFFNLAPNGAGLPRLSSLLGEPGCSQFIFNFLLTILITQKEKISKILFVGIVVLLTRSTTGYLNLIFLLILFFRINKISIIKVSLISTVIFFVGLYSLISDNISDKFADTSGIIRTRDFYVGYELTKRHPIMGVDTDRLEFNPEAQRLEDEIWGTSGWTSTQGYFAGGYTNGLFGVFLDYGLIVGLILYILTIKAPIIWNNKKIINPYCFFAVYFCSLIGEPISRTSLFFIFALSYLVNFRKNRV